MVRSIFMTSLERSPQDAATPLYDPPLDPNQLKNNPAQIKKKQTHYLVLSSALAQFTASEHKCYCHTHKYKESIKCIVKENKHRMESPPQAAAGTTTINQFYTSLKMLHTLMLHHRLPLCTKVINEFLGASETTIILQVCWSVIDIHLYSFMTLKHNLKRSKFVFLHLISLLFMNFITIKNKT